MKYSIDKVLSSGVCLGKIHKIEINGNIQDSSDYEKLNKAIEKSVSQIKEMMMKAPELQDYLMVQEYMITDPELKKRVCILLDEGISIVKAVNAVMKEFTKGLAKSDSLYLKERTNDIEDAERRILMNLQENNQEEEKGDYILYTEKPYPSFLINHKDNILGIISKIGGYTSHTAILARSYDIPYIVTDVEFIEGEEVLFDTRKKSIITNPSALAKSHFKKDTKVKRAIVHEGNFLANCAAPSDVKKAMDYNFDGVGLFRTEMIFMNSNRPFTAIEQYKIYKDAIKVLDDKKLIVFRTFDVSGDKHIAYVTCQDKSIENYKQNPYIFENQVMAILKIYTDTKKNIRIMFPMIYSNEEFLYLRDWVINLASRFDYKVPPIGMMLETKEALENIKDFTMTDFISVGTNDLVKALYNLDRENSFDSIDTFVDDLIDKLKVVVNYCNENRIYLSICGELASIPEIAEKFLAIGVKNLSVSPSLVNMLNIAYTSYKEKNKK